MISKYFFVAFLMLVPVESEIGLVLQQHNVSCHSNNTVSKIFECDSIKHGTGYFLFNLRLMVTRNFGRDVDLHVQSTIQALKATTSLKLVDFKINFCSLLQQGISNSVLKVPLDAARRTSNFPFKCPLKANFLYKFVNYTVTDKALPSYIPAMNETYSVTIYEKNQYVASYVSRSVYLSRRN